MRYVSDRAAMLFAIALIATMPAPPAWGQRMGNVDLVVQITVDQLRGDMPARYADRFGRNGFRYLMDRGVWYTDAHFLHTTTFTAVGHATLFTGGNPPEHGLVANDWLDVATGRQMYCVADARHHLIGRPPSDNQGVSPRNLNSSTTGDELHLATAGRSRIYSVSIKDRGAILPGGHLGKAFWYDRATGEFVTSTYYYDAYPQWVNAFNEQKHADQYMGKTWELLHDLSTYVYRDQDDRAVERPQPGMGRTFPHAIGHADDAAQFYNNLRYTPYGDELTLKFTLVLMEQKQLGRGEATDMLALSLSALDYVGHAYGPNSLEYEDHMLRLDALLAELFTHIDQTVGLDRTLIVLASDHGVDSAPELRAELTHRPLGAKIDAQNVPLPHHGLSMCCGRHEPTETIDAINAALREQFDVDTDLVIAFWSPSIYLDDAAMATAGLDSAEVEAAVATKILTLPGYALALTRTQMTRNQVPDAPHAQAVLRAFHPQRSGHVMVVQKPFWYLYEDAHGYAAMHGSPYSYDTFVPIMFAGPNIEPAEVARRVAPRDVAPTIAAYLGILPPSASVGNVLPEVMR